jgi:DNA-binding NarL/FixJ family response regulator
VRTCLDAGARGYLLKNAIDLELVRCRRKVAAGEQVLDPRSSGAAARPAGALPPHHARTGSAATDRRMASPTRRSPTVLGLSANTVAVHRANIMQTLGIHNTAELVVYAIRNGLVSIA